MRYPGRQFPRHGQIRGGWRQLGDSQGRVTGEHPLVQLPQPRARLSAELLDQDPAGVLIGGQRLGLAAAAIQRQHQQAVQVLPQRMPGD
jgi:hypothetical protein